MRRFAILPTPRKRRKLIGRTIKNFVASKKKFDCYAANKKFFRVIEIFLLNHLVHAIKQFYGGEKFVLYSIAITIRDISKVIKSSEFSKRGGSLKVLN